MAEHDDLKNLVQHSNVVVVDKQDVTHHMSILDLGDLSEIYSRYGSVDNVHLEDTETVLFLSWLLLRKEGLTEAKMDTGDWAYSQSKIGRLFSIKQYPALVEAVIKCMIASGIYEERNTEADPMAPGVEAGTVPKQVEKVEATPMSGEKSTQS